jgi:hypothetical protein
MRATDLIRNVLDLIDAIDTKPTGTIEITDIPNEPGEQTSRFKQIFQILSNRDVPTEYSNSPNEVVTDVDSVTTLAGGGVNGNKHPADIKGEHPSLYPGKVYGAK